MTTRPMAEELLLKKILTLCIVHEDSRVLLGMKKRGFGIDEIPFDEMWSDDKYWFPLFLANKKFRGRFLLDENDAIIEMNLREAQKIENYDKIQISPSVIPDLIWPACRRQGSRIIS